MLEVRDLSVSYGQHRALSGASLRVGRGEIVVILGANGAGKTTLLKAVCGISEGRATGEVVMEGADLLGLAPDKIVEAGIALVPEGRGVFADLSVQENLTLGAYAARARDEEAGNLERVFTLFPKLDERRRQIVRTMSGGEQQMVAIGRAMMSNPAILGLDEPSLGLSPLLCKELFQSLGTVREAGLGVLLVEQNAKRSLAIADRGYLLENGEIVHEDSAENLANDPAVQKAYLGGSARPAQRPATLPAPGVTAPRPPRGPAPSEIAARALQGISVPPRPDPVPPVQHSMPAPTSPDLAKMGAGSSGPGLAPPRLAPPRLAPTAAVPRPAIPPTPGGIDVAALVKKAEGKATRRPAAAPTSSQRRNGAGTTASTEGAAGGLAGRPATPNPPITPMPDLASGADRLKSVLEEMEQAARRAETYRPLGRPRDTRT